MTRYIILLVVSVIAFTAYCNAQHSFISRGYESDTLSKEQLYLITKFTKEPAIIGLGEADHLKASFYRIKCQLVRRLILRNGVDLVLFEADLNTCAQLDKYVKGDSSIQLRPLLTQMNATNNYILHNLLNTPEIEGLINWIRNYNTTHDKKVSLGGIDFQMPVNLGNVIAPHLSPALHTELTEVINVYSKFYNGYMDYKNVLRLFTVDSLKRQAADAAKKVQHINNYLSNNEDKWLQANLSSLVCMSGFFTNPNGAIMRDSIMYNNLCLQIKDHKTIVWAATQHLEDNSFWMGGHIRRHWGEDFFNIGIFGKRYDWDKYDNVILELFFHPTDSMQGIINVISNETPFATVL